MRCPVDEEVLQISERQGVEIDYCPRCQKKSSFLSEIFEMGG
jgi:Zn-finger nucleic acid-binding protein